MLEKEKSRKTPASNNKKKAAKPAPATHAAPIGALPASPREKAPALPPASPRELAQERVTQGSAAAAAGPKQPLTAEARWRMIAEAAYFKAQRRGFTGGDAKRDWAEAEEEIDAWLLKGR
jgi:hypothetical protein